MAATVAIGHDHAGRLLRATVVAAVEAAGCDALVVSADSAAPTDYPDVAAAVAEAISTGRAQRGILVSGSGAGVTLAANAFPLIRAALAHEEYMARQMVEEDDVNALAIGARAIGPGLAAAVIGSFLGASFSGDERHARRLEKVIHRRRDPYHNALRQLAEAGQSVWLDVISRSLIDDGTLARYIAELFVSGLTSNPSILHGAIGTGSGYDDRIRSLVNAGTTDPEEIAFGLALDDLIRAADLLLPTYHATRGADGFVSIEVSPTLVHDGVGTVAAGRRLFKRAGRPNVMIKVPGTPAGLSAAEGLLAGGIPVNVTLLFSPDHYCAAAEAYLTAMERRLDAGLSPRVPSVASIFVSRWDVAVDGRIPASEQGRLGLSVAHEIYAAYRNLLGGARFLRLEARNALPQRVLWASTGTKNPALPDTYYLARLAAPGTVNTVPEKTLLAYADHGTTCDLMEPDLTRIRRSAEVLQVARVNIDDLAARLQIDGAAAFATAWSDLLNLIRTRLTELP